MPREGLCFNFPKTVYKVSSTQPAPSACRPCVSHQFAGGIPNKAFVDDIFVQTIQRLEINDAGLFICGFVTGPYRYRSEAGESFQRQIAYHRAAEAGAGSEHLAVVSINDEDDADDVAVPAVDREDIGAPAQVRAYHHHFAVMQAALCDHECSAGGEVPALHDPEDALVVWLALPGQQSVHKGGDAPIAVGWAFIDQLLIGAFAIVAARYCRAVTRSRRWDRATQRPAPPSINLHYCLNLRSVSLPKIGAYS